MPSLLTTAAPAAAGRGGNRGHRGTAQHRTPWPYRLVLVGAGLAAIGLFALLRAAGATETYNDLFHLWRVEPFRWPFLDIHAVLSAVECHRLGWDVFEQNPCDVMERVHVYSRLLAGLAGP